MAEKMFSKDMRLNSCMQTVLPQHDELLDTLHHLDVMTIGRNDRIFCNSFIKEAIRLLINAVFLYEDGYFDCAFYSVRQAAETCNNMLYIANKGTSALKQWDKKNHFPMNGQLLSQLSQIDTFYSQIRENLSVFLIHIKKQRQRVTKLFTSKNLIHFI